MKRIIKVVANNIRCKLIHALNGKTNEEFDAFCNMVHSMSSYHVLNRISKDFEKYQDYPADDVNEAIYEKVCTWRDRFIGKSA